MRTLSLTMREALTAQATDKVPVTLVTLTHPTTADVVRLSSDPTVNLMDLGLSSDLRYGTLSNGEVFTHVLMTRVWPDDKEGENPSGQMTFDNVASDYVKVLRSFVVPATCNIRLVLSDAPDTVEMEFDAMATLSATGNASTITVDISREDYTHWPWPCHRMTKDRFPGQH
ncbi:hypothetical protein V5F53_10995 [Xanthobacter sp. V4C-4]|uniref:hypothetical protein n=1 Tax=Xanthobacter cornucopiae TaxID=3119924 RepID=UPI00372C2987